MIYANHIYYSGMHLMRNDLFIYAQELSVKINNENVEVKDIRYNRRVTFNHWVRDSDSSNYIPIIKQHNNTIICYRWDKNSSEKEQAIYTVIMVSENSLTKYVNL